MSICACLPTDSTELDKGACLYDRRARCCVPRRGGKAVPDDLSGEQYYKYCATPTSLSIVYQFTKPILKLITIYHGGT